MQLNNFSREHNNVCLIIFIISYREWQFWENLKNQIEIFSIYMPMTINITDMKYITNVWDKWKSAFSKLNFLKVKMCYKYCWKFPVESTYWLL